MKEIYFEDLCKEIEEENYNDATQLVKHMIYAALKDNYDRDFASDNSEELVDAEFKKLQHNFEPFSFTKNFLVFEPSSNNVVTVNFNNAIIIRPSKKSRAGAMIITIEIYLPMPEKVGHNNLNILYTSQEIQFEFDSKNQVSGIRHKEKTESTKVWKEMASKELNKIERIDEEVTIVKKVFGKKSRHIMTKNGKSKKTLLSMPKIPGEDLEKYLENDMDLSTDECNLIIYNCIEGLYQLHQLGIAHNDVKAANVIINGTPPISNRV